MENNGETPMLLNSREGENKVLATIIQLSTASIFNGMGGGFSSFFQDLFGGGARGGFKEEQLTENQLHKKEKLNLV